MPIAACRHEWAQRRAQHDDVCAGLGEEGAFGQCDGRIRAGQDRRVIDAVSDHDDRLSTFLHCMDKLEFILGGTTGAIFADTECGSNALDGVFIVSACQVAEVR